MELAQELFVTAVVAVLFSFAVAKLVSLAMTGSDSVCESKFGGSRGDAVSGGPLVEEVRFGEDKLRGLGLCGETREVEDVDLGLRTVDRFREEPVADEGKVVVVEQSVCGEEEVGGVEGREATEEPSEESVDEEVCRQAELSACETGEVVECGVEETGGNCDEALREGNRLRDVGVRFPAVESGEAEAADVVVEEEGKRDEEKGEEEKEELEEEKGAEEKGQEEEEEDDWEGIERSQLEKDFAAAARFADDRRDRLEAAMGDETKMQLYGLHKVATEGPCRDSPPMAVKVAARAKWYR